MADKNIKERINTELDMIKINEKMRQNIRNSLYKRNTPHKILKTIAASLSIIILVGTTVLAGNYFLNKISVNDHVLPELDEMRVVNVKKLEAPKDKYGIIELDFNNYNTIQEKLGVHLLDSEMASNDMYLQGHLSTDNKDYAMIKMENYIIGDTSNFNYINDENRYEYDHGQKYYSTISLSIDIILSNEQLKNGWDSDYLGMYESIGEYTSSQGYKVNLIQDNNGDETLNTGVVSEKIAVFVSDGIRYTLRGRVSIETMKAIIDSME